MNCHVLRFSDQSIYAVQSGVSTVNVTLLAGHAETASRDDYQQPRRNQHANKNDGIVEPLLDTRHGNIEAG
jgi:hypothetical protein